MCSHRNFLHWKELEGVWKAVFLQQEDALSLESTSSDGCRRASQGLAVLKHFENWTFLITRFYFPSECLVVMPLCLQCVLLPSLGFRGRNTCWTSSMKTLALSPSAADGWIAWGRANTWWHWRTCATWASWIPILPCATLKARTQHSLSTPYCCVRRAKRLSAEAMTTKLKATSAPLYTRLCWNVLYQN